MKKTLSIIERLEKRAFLSAGSLDTTFGTGGLAFGPHGATGTMNDIAVLPSGKFLAAGNGVGAGSMDFTIAGFNPDGSADTTFGASGLVYTDFYGLADDARVIKPVSQGRFLVGGTAMTPDGPLMVVVRYRSDGTIDTTFGTHGKAAVRVSSSDALADLAIQADGKIVVLGDCSLTPASTGRDLMLVRFNANGTLDTTFGGGDGVVTADFGPAAYDTDPNILPPSDDLARGVAFQSDGRIVIVSSRGTDAGFQVARFNVNGELDTSFGQNNSGVYKFLGLWHDRTDGRTSIVVDAEDRILIGLTSGDSYRPYMALYRFNSDGTSYGAKLPLFDINYGWNMDLAVQADGKVVQVGSVDGKFAVIRYQPDLSLDTTFGAGGIELTDMGGTIDMRDIASAVAITQDGKILVGGSRIGGYSFALAQYESTGDSTETPYPTLLYGGGQPMTLNTEGLYRIVGTEGDDVITIHTSGFHEFDVQCGMYGSMSNDFSLVKSIVIVCLGGNDRVTVDAGLHGVVVLGGAGNDTIITGAGDDTITGNSGKDHIDGGDGNDRLAGSGGNDWIVGNLGADRLYGEAGKDLLEAGGGNDRIYAGADNDILGGGAGSDILYGEAGHDTISGGSGINDRAFDAAESDVVTLAARTSSGASTMALPAPAPHFLDNNTPTSKRHDLDELL